MKHATNNPSQTTLQPPPTRRRVHRTQEQVLAEIRSLSFELTDRNERTLLRCAIQEIKDRRNGKDF
jgi:hypothetical protein